MEQIARADVEIDVETDTEPWQITDRLMVFC